MKKSLVLLSIAASSILANESIEPSPIMITQKHNVKVLKDVSSEEIKSADLAEALMKNIASVSIVRRSAIANDIILRGAKKDNINVILDEAKIYGACPNRMDPATSHVLTNNIESVEVIEGPYDVENFGTLSGLVKVNMKKPTGEFGGDVNLNFGSFAYQKQSATIEGGIGAFDFLLSASHEQSDSYKDGDGNDFKAQQIAHGVPVANQYSKDDLEAYKKKTLMAKGVVSLNDDAQINLSYTANRSDNVLYANTPMDANYDDSDIYTLGYTHKNLSDLSKELNVEAYHSRVDHPMSTTLRNNGAMRMTNNMASQISGAKIKNAFEIGDALVMLGLDSSDRQWQGYYSNAGNSYLRDSISKTTTKNRALFAEYERELGAFNIEMGLRYDDTSINNVLKQDNDYESVSANIYTTYKLNDSMKYFFGLGRAVRVPDARELYFVNSSGVDVGNPNLKEVTNHEIDLGIEKMYKRGKIKSTLFYSKLDNYIYNPTGGAFENIDAKIYGLSLNGFYLLSDEWIVDYGLAYQRGKKDETSYSDKNLPEIPPLKANIRLTYEKDRSKLSTTFIAADSWDSYDSNGGEQELSGYLVTNLRYDYKINKSLEFSFGIDNLFDTTYATSNSYNDINLIGTGETSIINEPGRYFYTNIRYSF